MSLITCPECGEKISDKCNICIHCGYPVLQQPQYYTLKLSEFAADQNMVIFVILVSSELGISKMKAAKSLDPQTNVIHQPMSLNVCENLRNRLAERNMKAQIIPYDKRPDSVPVTQIKKSPDADTITCPRCGSTQIQTGKRGYSLMTGFLGASKTVNRCANCGYKWTPSYLTRNK